jgi:transcription antitermination factor NusG
LALAGFEVYSPHLRARARVRGRYVETAPALFPGYLFVLVLPTRWYPVKWCLGVQALVMNGGGPARISDNVIHAIKAREKAGLVELPKPRGLRHGDRVKIVRGPFVDRLGLYAGQPAHQRVLVLLGLLGGERRVELPADAIAPLDEVVP